jgi:hypothetical protein
LKRAKLAPLRLSLDWPVDKTLIEIISSRNCSIESLAFNEAEVNTINSDPDISTLNLTSLKQVQMISLDIMMTQNLLETISSSINGDLALTLVKYPLGDVYQLLKHDIIQQTMNLCIISGISVPPINIRESDRMWLFRRRRRVCIPRNSTSSTSLDM